MSDETAFTTELEGEAAAERAVSNASNETSPITELQGEASAILAISENADDSIKDLIDSYKSATWDDPAAALQIVEDSANKLRQKTPEQANLLSAQETMDIVPVKPVDVGGYIDTWEKENIAKAKEGGDPFMRAYQNSIVKSIEDVATGEHQKLNATSQWVDKTARFAQAAIPGIAKELGLEKYLERNMRADSNDTLASLATSVVGSIASVPITPLNIIANPVAFGREQYKESRAAGSSVPRALGSAAVEGTNQAIDVIFDKVFFGGKVKKAAGFVYTGLKKALGEGVEEYAQNKLSDAADLFGLSKDERDAWVTDQDAKAFAAGVLGGGIAHGVDTAVPGLLSADPLNANKVIDKLNPFAKGDSNENPPAPGDVQPPAPGDVQPPPPGPPVEDDPGSSLAEDLGISIFPEVEPRASVAVVGEPVADSTNITTVEDAGTGEVNPTDATRPILNTDQGEIFIGNPDGTVSRVVNGEKKQAQSNATIISKETAKKVADLQAVEPGGLPVVIRVDDLGRAYINHPYVDSNLNMTEAPVNVGPVMIPESDTGTGHVLQTSTNLNALDSVQHAATVSKGESSGVSGVGAEALKESSVADKMRQLNNLNPHVKAILGLDEDISALVYVPNTNIGTKWKVDNLMAGYDNNYLSFANDVLAKDLSEITPTEELGMSLAHTRFSEAAEAVRATNPALAEQYDVLSGRMGLASVALGTDTAQRLQGRSVIPITGGSVVAMVKQDARDLATVRAAQDAGVSVKQVDNIVQEDAQLDKISEGLNEREGLIAEGEVAAQERHDAPDKAVADIEKQITDLDNAVSPEIAAAEKALEETDKVSKEVETQAADLEKQADDIETAQEQASQQITDLTAKVAEIQAKPVEVGTTEISEVSPEVVAAEKVVEKTDQTIKDIETNISTLEKNKVDLEDTASPELTAAEKAVADTDKATKEAEAQAVALEKEADDIETAQEQATPKVVEITKKIKSLETKPAEATSSVVERLKTRRAAIPTSDSSPVVKAAKKKLSEAKDLTEKGKARLELVKIINEERAKGVKALAAIDAEIQAAKEAHAAEQLRAKEIRAAEIKAAKEALAEAKREASDSKKAEVLAKRKQANELRAERKKDRLAKSEALAEARKKERENKSAAVLEAKKKRAEEIASAKETLTKAREKRALEIEAVKEAKAKAKKDAATTKQAQAAEQKRLHDAKTAEVKAAREALAEAKKEAATSKKAEVLAKRKQANDLRAERKRIRADKAAALVEARKAKAADLVEAKKAKREQLQKARDERNATKQLRKEQLALDREKLKALKDTLSKDREKIQARKDHNKVITDAVDRYKKEFNDRLTPAVNQKINDLLKHIQTLTGTPRRAALYEIAKTIAAVKGQKLSAGSDWVTTFWSGNVLLNLGTNLANIGGNTVAPLRAVFRDVTTGQFSKAGRFIRGWAGEMFGRKILSDRTLQDIRAGALGELPSRVNETDKTITKENKDIKELAEGVGSPVESDPVRKMMLIFGTGKLGKFMSYPMVSLRMLGAMDAVFHRAAVQGYAAREEPSFEQYLKNKATDYAQYSTQARNEEAQLTKLGVELPKNYVNMRADELSFAARPEAQRTKITKNAQRDVLQEEGGPRGFIGRWTAAILNKAGDINVEKTKTLNPQGMVLNALRRTTGTARDSIDRIYPLVVRGVSEGRTLVINGKDVTTGSTKQILGELLTAITNKQVIGLRGKGIRPFKLAVGMFVNTASQVLDMSLEGVPAIGYLDKRFGGKWKEYSREEKMQFYGTQVASSLITGALLSAYIPNADDEENSYFYVYGSMRDQLLKKSYEAKGIKPFSFRLGTTTFVYKDVPILNLIFGGMGELSDAYMVAKRTPDRPLSVGAAMNMMAMGSVYAATQMSLVKNIGVFSDLLGDLATLGNSKSSSHPIASAALDVASNMTTGFVPYSGAGRELERFIYGDLPRPKDVSNRMLQNIPFAKIVISATGGELEPALNIFGEPLRSHVIPGLGRFFGDTKSSFELDWALSNGYTFSLPKASNALSKDQLEQYKDMQKSSDPDNFEPYLTEKDQREYMKRVGPELKRILGEYANSNPHGWDEDVQSDLNTDIKEMKSEIKDSILEGN